MYVRTCAGIIGMYICFGALNWIAYGKSTQVVLTLNLPRGPWKASVQLAYSLAVVFTFPLQLYPAVQILKSVGRKLKRLSVRRTGYVAIDEGTPPPPQTDTDTDADTPTRANKPPRPRTSKLEGNAARTCVVALLVALAVVEVRHLDKIVALIGGFLGIPLAFVYPLAVHLRLVPHASPSARALNVCAMVVGVVLGVACPTVTVLTWNRS